MRRSTWRVQLWGLLVYPVAVTQTYMLFRPDNAGEFFFLSFVCLLFGVIYAFLGYMTRDSQPDDDEAIASGQSG
jgi:hypothetical protein